MDKFLEIAGILTVLLASLAALIIVGSSGNAATLLFILPWVVTSVIGGVVLAAFGSMLAQLKAIRNAVESQVLRNGAASYRPNEISNTLPTHMKKCRECASPIRADANICSYCGAKQSLGSAN